MKVLMIGPQPLSKGGIATVIKNFEQMPKYEDIDISFLYTWKEGSLLVRIWVALLAMLKIRIIIRLNNIDIVHIHMAQNGSFFRKSIMIWLINKKVPIILHMHASHFDVFYQKQTRFTQFFIKKTLSKATNIVALSKKWSEFYNPIVNTSVNIIRNAVPIPSKNIYNAEALDIIMLGRIGERKGSKDLISIISEIKLCSPKSRIYFFGDGDVEQIKASIPSLYSLDVIFGGWISEKEKKEIFQKAAIHVLPSYNEGMPMAILETMASGIPNVSTFVGGIPEVIENGVNGTLINPGDTEQLKISICSLLIDKELRKSFSYAAYNTIKNDFSLEVYFKQWAEIYHNAIIKFKTM